MPAGSEVSLPHTWRPLGVRLAGVVFGSMMLIVGGWAWINFPADVKDDFNWLQRVTVILLGGLFLGIYYAMARSRIVARESGLLVVNGFRGRELEWAEIVRVGMPSGAPWVRFDLADGNTISGLGIQSSDGNRAYRAVQELRTLVEQRSAGNPDTPGH